MIFSCRKHAKIIVSNIGASLFGVSVNFGQPSDLVSVAYGG